MTLVLSKKTDWGSHNTGWSHYNFFSWLCSDCHALIFWDLINDINFGYWLDLVTPKHGLCMVLGLIWIHCIYPTSSAESSLLRSLAPVPLLKKLGLKEGLVLVSRLRSVKEQKNNPERNKTDLSDKGRERERHSVRVTWQQHRASGWLIMCVLKARESWHNKNFDAERQSVRAKNAENFLLQTKWKSTRFSDRLHVRWQISVASESALG